MLQNKKISDSLDDALSLQGIGFVIRSGLKVASPKYDIKQTHDGDVTILETHQSGTGVKDETETKRYDGTTTTQNSWFFGGDIDLSAYWVEVASIQEEYLREGWVDDEPKLIGSRMENKAKGWVSKQVNGFRSINGERRYVSRTLVVKGSKTATCQLVYDFVA